MNTNIIALVNKTEDAWIAYERAGPYPTAEKLELYAAYKAALAASRKALNERQE